MNIHQRLDYDAWATQTLLCALEKVTPEGFVREYAGSLGSLRQQFVHLLSVADRYRARLAQEAVPDVAPASFACVQDIVVYQAQVQQRSEEFVARLNPNDWQRPVEHATRQGVFRATVEQTLQHICNHSTYHRGQIACLLKIQGVDFPDTDLIIWLNQQNSL